MSGAYVEAVAEAANERGDASESQRRRDAAKPTYARPTANEPPLIIVQESRGRRAARAKTTLPTATPTPQIVTSSPKPRSPAFSVTLREGDLDRLGRLEEDKRNGLGEQQRSKRR